MLGKTTESLGIKNPSTYEKSACYCIIICVTYRLISRGSMGNGKGKRRLEPVNLVLIEFVW